MLPEARDVRREPLPPPCYGDPVAMIFLSNHNRRPQDFDFHRSMRLPEANFSGQSPVKWNRPSASVYGGDLQIL